METTSMPPPIVGFPYAPGFSLSGFFGDLNSGWGDIMLPLAGRPDAFWYVDPQALYHSSDEYSGSVGTGFRVLTENVGILGAYVFGDYNHSDAGHSFWFVSPGIERLGEILDFSVNAYIPVSTQRVNTGTFFASDLGNFDFVQFSGHDSFDQLVNTFESTGFGVDGEVGCRIPFLWNNTKLYLGGYYFTPKDTDSITGGTVRIEVPITNYLSISASDAYDNISHNTIKGGITLSLGGRSTHFTDYALANRMVDPIQRNRVAMEGRSPTSQYIAEGQDFTGQEVLYLSNIWFFSPTGVAAANGVGTEATPVSLGQCTYEHPCSSNDVNTDFFAGINAVAPGANMYLASGSYNNINGALEVNAGQSMYGRSSDFTSPASGTMRPTLTGSLDLFGNNRIDSLILNNDPNPAYSQLQGVLLEDGAQAVSLSHSEIGNTGAHPSTSYVNGVVVNNNSQLFIKGSTINAYSEGFEIAAGVIVNGSNNLINIGGSQVNVVGNSNIIFFPTAGLYNIGDQNTWIVVGNQVNVSNGPNAQQGVFYGIYSPGGTDMYWKVLGNKINVAVDAEFSNGYGIFVENNQSDWTIAGNKINVDGVSTFNSNIVGIRIVGGGAKRLEYL